MNGNDTIIGQGSFTQGATAVAQIIAIPCGADWVEVYNYTQASGTAGSGFHFYWQRANGSNTMGTTGIVEASGAAGAVSVTVTAANAFVIYDPSLGVPGSSVAVTGFTAANPGVITAANTTGISAGSIVRFDTLNGVGQQEYNGIDFSVGYGTLTGTTFSVDYLNTTSSTPSTVGNWRLIPYNPLFYPRRRVITNISSANPCVITLSVDHGFTVGQKVRLNIVGGTAKWANFASLSNYDDGAKNSTTPDAFTITAVNIATGVGNNTITIDADTTGFGTFRTVWQAIAGSAYTPCEVIPVGEDTSYAITSLSQQTPQVNGVQIFNTNTGLLADSTVNTGFLGMILAAGATLPAGAAADVVFWKAGKSSFGGQY